MAILAPQFSPYDPAERVGPPFSPPSTAHLLGTNDIGQDILSELIYGARLAVGRRIRSCALHCAGTVVGLLAGYYRRLEHWLMRLADVVLVLPFLPLLIVLAAYVGRSLTNTVIIIGLLLWAGTARLIRSQTLALSQRDIVLAAATVGCTRAHPPPPHLAARDLFGDQRVPARHDDGHFAGSLAQFPRPGRPAAEELGAMLYWAQALAPSSRPPGLGGCCRRACLSARWP